MIQTTLCSVARLIVETLDRHGIDGIAEVRAAGLDPERLHDPNARYPYEGMTRLWLRAVELSHDPCFGLQVAQRFHPTSLHGIAFAWLASATLLEALQRLVRYFRVATTATEATLSEIDGGYRLQLGLARGSRPPAAAASDATAAVVLHLCRLSLGESFRPLHVGLPHGRPDRRCAERFVQLMRAPVTFDAPLLTVDVASAAAETLLPSGNAELAHANERVLVDYLAHLDRNAISAQVKARLVDALPSGPVSESSMARSLHLSTRSLQRRLSAEQTSFRQLLDDTRRELALQFLGNSRLTISEVTYLLGFSDPSNFTRAFRRWHGTSPSDYREEQRIAGSA